MKTRTVLQALLIAYALTGSFLFVLAFILFKFNLGEGFAAAGIVTTYAVASLVGGISAGRSIRKNRVQWGTITGLAYYILLLAAGFAVSGKWDMSFQHLLTTGCMCLGGGALGGILS